MHHAAGVSVGYARLKVTCGEPQGQADDQQQREPGAVGPVAAVEKWTYGTGHRRVRGASDRASLTQRCDACSTLLMQRHANQ